MKKSWIDTAGLMVGGDLLQRAQLNYDRMESDYYSPEQAFMPADYEWPGDKEGRLILALALLAQATHRTPLYLDTILSELPERMNELGYCGAIEPAGQLDEQQLSGNGWLLRGLCEVYAWKREPAILTMIERLARHLFLPARGLYRDYPARKEDRVLEGEAIGSLTSMVGNWRLSTDIGCAFIALDGVTRAYEWLGWPELKELIGEMIASFRAIDLQHISAQTHATLSALRGMLRMAELEGDRELLAAAEAVYALYRQQGITENYANYNWFGRPEWTEPCAVVDSYLVALSLWSNTGKTEYLQDSHLIYYNGLSRGQRHNGGLGCDCCAGAKDPYLYALDNLYEAFWCCSMRGAEGWYAAAQTIYAQDRGGLYMTAYHDHTAIVPLPDGSITVSVTTRYPYYGHTRIAVIDSDTASPPTLHLFLPSWSEPCSVRLQVNGEAQACSCDGQWLTYAGKLGKGDVITLEAIFSPRVESMINANSIGGHVTLWHGPLLLSAAANADADAELKVSRLTAEPYAVYREEAGRTFAPVYTPIQQVRKEDLLAKKQLLFRSPL